MLHVFNKNIIKSSFFFRSAGFKTLALHPMGFGGLVRIKSLPKDKKPSLEQQYLQATKNFEACCSKGIEQNEQLFVTVFVHTNEPIIEKILPRTIPQVFIRATGGHTGFIIHGLNLHDSSTAIMVSKVPGGVITKSESFLDNIMIHGKIIQLVYREEDYQAKARYEDFNIAEPNWLLANSSKVADWQKLGSECIIMHLCGQMLLVNLEDLKKVLKQELAKDNIYDRQHNACPHPLMEFLLPKEKYEEFSSYNLFTSLSPQDTLPMLIEYGIKDSIFKRQLEARLKLLRPHNNFVDKIKSILENNAEYLKLLGLTEDDSSSFKGHRR